MFAVRVSRPFPQSTKDKWGQIACKGDLWQFWAVRIFHSDASCIISVPGLLMENA